MTILSLIFMGIVTAVVMAAEGDFSGLAKIGEILIYVVIIGALLVFLSKTGWGGLFLLLIISFVVVGFTNMKD